MDTILRPNTYVYDHSLTPFPLRMEFSYCLFHSAATHVLLSHLQDDQPSYSSIGKEPTPSPAGTSEQPLLPPSNTLSTTAQPKRSAFARSTPFCNSSPSFDSHTSTPNLKGFGMLTSMLQSTSHCTATSLYRVAKSICIRSLPYRSSHEQYPPSFEDPKRFIPQQRERCPTHLPYNSFAPSDLAIDISRATCRELDFWHRLLLDFLGSKVLCLSSSVSDHLEERHLHTPSIP